MGGLVRGVCACTLSLLTACAGTPESTQAGGAGGPEIGATDVAQSAMAWIGSAAKNVKDHWVMPQDSTLQFVGGKASSRESARQNCVRNALVVAANAKNGNGATANMVSSAGARAATPMLARSMSSSYVGAIQTGTMIDPLVRIGGAVASLAFSDNLQTVVDEYTSECMIRQGYKLTNIQPGNY